MSRETINHLCEYCESQYKIIYDDADVSSLPKFCIFCNEETFSGKDDDLELDLDEDQELG